MSNTLKAASKLPPSASETLLRRALDAAAAITDEEDSAILAAALLDPDAQPRRRGRPKAQTTKTAVLLRLDPDVVDHFKAGGEGWQTRMNAELRKIAGLN